MHFWIKVGRMDGWMDGLMKKCTERFIGYYVIVSTFYSPVLIENTRQE